MEIVAGMALPDRKRGAGCKPDESQAKSPSGFFIFSHNSATV